MVIRAAAAATVTTGFLLTKAMILDTKAPSSGVFKQAPVYPRRPRVSTQNCPTRRRRLLRKGLFREKSRPKERLFPV